MDIQLRVSGRRRQWRRSLMALAFGVVVPLAHGKANWEAIGPDGGDRFMVKLSPANPNTLFVLGYNAIHRSRDGGAQWVRTLTEPMAVDTFLDIAFKGPSAQQLFVCGSFRGVWYSPNEGDTWESRSTGLPLEDVGKKRLHPVTGLAVGPSGSLFAGVSGDNGHLPPFPVYRSDNLGLTWVADSAGIAAATGGKSVTLLSTDANTQLWATVYGSGVYRHTANGWVNLNGNLPVAARKVTYLEHDPHHAGRMLLGTEDQWVYQSHDGGLNWSPLPKPAELASVSVLPLVYSINVDPNNTSFILVRANSALGSLEQPLFAPRADQVEGAGLYVSVNSGLNWTHRSIFVFRMVPDARETIQDNIPGLGNVRRTKRWYRTAGGHDCMLLSTNGTISFEPITRGITTTWMNDVWVHPNPPAGYEHLVYAASEDGLFLMSNDVADAWSFAISGTSPVYTWSFAENPAVPGQVYYSMGNPAWSTLQQRGIYRIDLNTFGKEWNPATGQILVGTGVWRVVTSPAQPTWIFAACQEAGILVSFNSGVTWQPAHAGLPVPASVTDLILDAQGIPLFAGLRRSNGGYPNPNQNPWIPQENEPGGVFAFNPSNQVWTLLAGMTNAVYDLQLLNGSTPALYAATSAGVHKFTEQDGWTLLSQPLVISDVLVDPTKPEVIYAASPPLGVFRTTDGGEQWHEYSGGLPVGIVFTLDRDPESGTLYAGMGGGSVARLVREANPTAEIGVHPPIIAFGAVPVGLEKRVDVTVTNIGEANLTITGLTPNHATLTVRDAPALPVVLTPGGWTTFTLGFSPTVTTPVHATVTINGNATNAPFHLPVAGSGYTEKGTLAIQVQPVAATWLAETPWGGVTGRTGNIPPTLVPTGTYTVAWQPLAGYALPTNQPAVVHVQVGQGVVASGIYRTPQRGALALKFSETFVAESAVQAVVHVVRANGSDGVVTVNYATADQTAKAGVDYTAVNGTLTFQDGETTNSFAVPLLGDAGTEGEETFAVTLSAPTGGATLGNPASGSVRMADAAGVVSFSAPSYEVDEGNVNVSVELLRSLGSGGSVSVAFATSNGTATAGVDYVGTNGTVVFADGQLSRTLTIRVLDDAAAEPDETVFILLSHPTGGVGISGPTTARLTILDSSDTDLDGLPDWWEMQHFGNATNAVPTLDADGDGLTNLEEYEYLTLPKQADTDGDGFSDGIEVMRGTDPLRADIRPLIIITDFDGDQATDLGVYRPENGWWYVRQSQNGQQFSGGPVAWHAGSVPVPGDYDGDGFCDFAAYVASNATWYILQSSTDTLWGNGPFPFGWSETTPVPGDYDGDGKTDLAVYWQAGGQWYIRQSSTGILFGGGAFAFGWSDAMPVPADYDGDGKVDLAVFHRAAGQWYIRQSKNGALFSGGPFPWGWSSNLPVPGDYDGDGKADIAVYDPPSGDWFVRMSSTGATLGGGPIKWGQAAATPVPGDYDGDFKTDIAVYGPGNGKWYIRQSSNGLMLGGGTDVNGGISWGHPTVYPMQPAYQILRRLGLAP